MGRIDRGLSATSQKRWLENHRKEYNTYQRKYGREQVRKLREEIMDLLGGRKCCICGYIGLALEIDHVNNDGYKEKKVSGHDRNYYRRILRKIKKGSKDYQILCSNCNQEKRLRNVK